MINNYNKFAINAHVYQNFPWVELRKNDSNIFSGIITVAGSVYHEKYRQSHNEY